MKHYKVFMTEYKTWQNNVSQIDSSLNDLFESYMEKRDVHLNIVRELWKSLHNPIYNLSTKTEMVNQLLREMDRQVIMHYELQSKMLSLDLSTCLISTRRVGNFKEILPLLALPSSTVTAPQSILLPQSILNISESVSINKKDSKKMSSSKSKIVPEPSKEVSKSVKKIVPVVTPLPEENKSSSSLESSDTPTPTTTPTTMSPRKSSKANERTIGTLRDRRDDSGSQSDEAHNALNKALAEKDSRNHKSLPNKDSASTSRSTKK